MVINMIIQHPALKKISLLLSILFFSSVLLIAQSTEKQKNAKIGAVYIYNFSKQIQWANLAAAQEFRIGILGNENELAQELAVLTATRKIKDLPVKIISFKTVSEITSTEILYVDVKNNSSVNLNKLMVKNTLLITKNNQNFSNTMITFIIEGGWQKFALNEKNVLSAGLTVAESLKSLAITTSAGWTDAFGKIKFILSHDSSGLKIDKNDMAEVVATQEKQLHEIEGKNQQLLTQEELLKQKELEAAKLNEYIDAKRASLAETEDEIDQQKKTLNTQQTEIDNQAAILKQQKIVITIFVTLCVFILGLALMVYRNYRAKNKANIILEKQKVEIIEQKKVIEVKNHEIVDSINYAKKIQLAVLPDLTHFESKFNDAFVLFMPKDIVSGDFFWIHQTEDALFYATADCTGHGVPGGFMSILNNSLLNEVVIEKKIHEPGDVLDMLRLKVIKALKQQGKTGEQQDGMDLSFCKIDSTFSKLSYAAANNPIWMVRNGSLIEHPANSQPIGISYFKINQFDQKTIELKKGDIVYTFTDGYADQFGGEKGKKFMTKRLKETLISIHSMPLQKQRDELESRFRNWQGDNEQVDDVLIIGVKI